VTFIPDYINVARNGGRAEAQPRETYQPSRGTFDMSPYIQGNIYYLKIYLRYEIIFGPIFNFASEMLRRLCESGLEELLQGELGT
jgi:hypothetical protein